MKRMCAALLWALADGPWDEVRWRAFGRAEYGAGGKPELLVGWSLLRSQRRR